MFPELFHVRHFSMPTYGVLFALGIILGTWVTGRNCERLGIDEQKARNLALVVAVCGVVGAKLLAIANGWDFYASHPGELFGLTTLQSGGVFLGGFVGALIAGVWYMRRNGMPALLTADAFAPGIALGHAIGRIGCFAAGCCWGKPTATFWGVTFKNPLAHQWAGTPLGIPLVPTQLLESSAEFANFIILMGLFRNKQFDGQVIGAYFFLYGFARYGLEYLRDDPGRGAFFGGAVSGAQLICVALVLGAVFLWARSFSLFSSRLAK